MSRTIWSKRDEYDYELEMKVELTKDDDGELMLHVGMYGVNYFHEISSRMKLTEEDRQELINALQGNGDWRW